MKDKFLPFRDATSRALFNGPGATSNDLRVAVAAGSPPQPLLDLVGKIRSRAYSITDQDLASIRSVHGDEGVFEIIVAAAFGMASEQLNAARRALEEA